jgi:L-lactate dehydrogenase complex protein LldF
LPYHSSLCGSCSEVCPVKIDIADQIYKWRRVIASEGLLPVVKSAGMKAAGAILAHPTMFRSAEAISLAALAHLPRAVLDNPLNPWTKHREMPAPPELTFRAWYQQNRGGS